MQLLLRHVFNADTGTELPQLWVPPVSAGIPGSSKTLVFTAMAVTTRCAAYFCDRYAKKLLRNTVIMRDDSTLLETVEWLANTIAKIVPVKQNKKNLICALTDFFNRYFVRSVICAHNKKYGWQCSDYWEAVLKYCNKYKFEEMIKEWVPIAEKTKDEKTKSVIDVIIRAFRHQPASIKERRWDNNGEKFVFINTDYTEMFVCDDDKSGNSRNDNLNCENANHRTVDDEKEIVYHFNSPLYPMVLVARSSAQEGHNLQYYGDKIMHWQTAGNISAFLQREGRLDSPGSLTLRHRLWQRAVSASVQTPKDYEDAKELFKKNCEPILIKKCKIPNGLFPIWYIPSVNHCHGQTIKPAEIVQILPVYEYNDSLDTWMKELAAAQEYPEPLKQPAENQAISLRL